MSEPAWARTFVRHQIANTSWWSLHGGRVVPRKATLAPAWEGGIPNVSECPTAWGKIAFCRIKSAVRRAERQKGFTRSVPDTLSTLKVSPCGHGHLSDPVLGIVGCHSTVDERGTSAR